MGFSFFCQVRKKYIMFDNTIKMLSGEYNFKVAKHLPKSLNYITSDDLVSGEAHDNYKSIKFDESVQEIDSYNLHSSYKESSFHYIKPNGIIIKSETELAQSKNIIITYSDNKIEYGKFENEYPNNDVLYKNKLILAVYRIKSWNKQYFIVYKDLTAHHVSHCFGMKFVKFNEGILEKIEQPLAESWTENLLDFFSFRW
jgi:hypothetical protein